MEDDGGVSRKSDRKEAPIIDIASEFDNFVHEVFEIEPPLGKPYSNRIHEMCGINEWKLFPTYH